MLGGNQCIFIFLIKIRTYLCSLSFKMKILLVGKTGQLGSSLIQTLPTTIADKVVEFKITSREELDLANPNKCEEFIIKYQPDYLINAAAYTAVDRAESQNKLTYQINSEAPTIFAKTLRKIGGKLIHFSTDYVFDGNKSLPYNTTDIVNPLNTYGLSKVQGEQNILEVMSSTEQAKIIRTSWVYNSTGNNFVTKIIKLIQSKKILKIVSDQISSPTSSISLAKFCWILIKSMEEGENFGNLIHFSDTGIASWYDFAYAVLEIGNDIGLFRSNTKILPIKSNEYKTLALRPTFSVLDNSLRMSKFDIEPKHWRIALRDVLNTINDNN